MADLVFCIDSDGCVMDTMTVKHEKFFGPIAVEVFEVANAAEFEAHWNKVNLYSTTRGINRYAGLVTGLEFAGLGEQIPQLKEWAETTSELSAESLDRAIAANPEAIDLQKTKAWSDQVNDAWAEYAPHTKPFDGAVEALAKIAAIAPIYIVSSANRPAIEAEWQQHDVLKYVKDVYTQERGKKEDVIAGLIADGANPDSIYMIGDAPGDFKAAELNDTWYYPIIAGQEATSWQELREQVLPLIQTGGYDATTQQTYTDKFWNNLK